MEDVVPDQRCARPGWKCIGVAAALAFSAGAFAQEAAPLAVRHLYVGGGVGQAQWRPGCPGTVADCDDTNTAVHAFAGYQLNPILAGEVAFTNYGKAAGTNAEIKGRGWEASAIAAWPVLRSTSVFGRLGAYRGVLKGGGQLAHRNESNYGFTYGIGAQTDFTPHFGARLEWQTFPGVGGSTLPDSDIKIISVSALWRFR
jgi:opacity protein-like surface antigen